MAKRGPDPAAADRKPAGSGETPGESPGELSASQEHEYFRRVEELFLRLRGAPMLLSPKDWQLAERWHRGQVPFELIERTLVQLFERRQRSGSQGRIQSLGYFADAVESAWAEIRQLEAVAERRLVAPLDVRARLAALVSSLPDSLAKREVWAERIAELEGEPETVERQLALLDRELIAAERQALAPGDRENLEASAGAALATVAARLAPEEREEVRDRLLEQRLRRIRRLPMLSLFSPQAEAACSPGPEES